MCFGWFEQQKHLRQLMYSKQPAQVEQRVQPMQLAQFDQLSCFVQPRLRCVASYDFVYTKTGLA